uniref:Retrovirus-related Pol polyprotein from transposon TNT 1-94 n=1 Tax=Tanacetum cinerariifolium TaxID=118510 RepID=A0A699GKU5_TANCI|nr:retrovirus-related Pol polyprotein from transposon TNT 1-94 [Tanacetum cinerariifolium]
MPMVLSLAWETIIEIEHAFKDKHSQPKDILELFQRLHNDVQNIREELAMYINTPSWDLPTICYNDDDDEDCTIAIIPILSIEEPDNSLSMGDEHLDTILETESDKLIKSSVENLVSVPSGSEGIPDNMCDVPFCDNSSSLDQFEDFSNSSDDSTSIDDDSFSIDDIECVEALPLDSELVSLEVVEIVIPKVGGIDADVILTIKDDILCEKLLNVNLLITKIKALKDNPTPSSDFVAKSSSTFLNFLLEETNTFDNSLPESETFALIWKRLVVAVPLLVLIFLFQIIKLSMTIMLKRLVVAVPLLILIFLFMIRSSLIFRSIHFLLPIGVIFMMNTKMKEGASVADNVNEFNSNLSRLMLVDIKFDDELKFDNIHDLVIGEDIHKKTSGEYLNSLLSAEGKGRGRKQDRGLKKNRGRLKSKKRGQSKNRQDITCWNCNQKGHFQNQCSKLVASKDKEVNMAVRDYDDALDCCVENTMEDCIMDSGASFHATFCKRELEKFRLRSSKTLKDVRYILGLKRRLIFIGQLDEEGYHGNIALWHQRLGHMSEKGMKILTLKGRIPDLQKAVVGFYEPCVLGNGRREYSSIEFIKYCVENEIRMLKTVLEKPQQNGFLITEGEWQGKEDSLAHLKAMAQMRCDIAFGIRRVTRSSEAEMSNLMRTLLGASRIVEDQMKKTLKTEHSPRREALRLHMYEDPPESPRLYKESIQWKKAINEEINLLEKNQTCSLIILPIGKKALQRKWVFRIKEVQDGSKRLVLSIVVAEDLHLEKLDVKTAFLNVDSVMYAMVCTRPDIAHAVRVVSRFMSNLGMEH